MKQHITVEQLSELYDCDQDILFQWWKPNYGDLFYDSAHGVISYSSPTLFRRRAKEHRLIPLLSIGQMIEFLDEQKWKDGLSIGHYVNGWVVGDEFHGDYSKYWTSPELCDALWEACKEILEDQPQ